MPTARLSSPRQCTAKHLNQRMRRPSRRRLPYVMSSDAPTLPVNAMIHGAHVPQPIFRTWPLTSFSVFSYVFRFTIGKYAGAPHLAYVYTKYKVCEGIVGLQLAITHSYQNQKKNVVYTVSPKDCRQLDFNPPMACQALHCFNFNIFKNEQKVFCNMSPI